MVEQIALNRAVVAVGEILAESAAVEAARAFLAAEDAADEVDLAIVGKQVDHFVIEALVEVVAVFVLEIADGLRVLELADVGGEVGDFLLQGGELLVSGHGGTIISGAGPVQYLRKQMNWLEGIKVDLFGGGRCIACDPKGSGKCARCFGTGQNTQLNSPEPKCPECRGSGVCTVCRGSGKREPAPRE